MCAADFIWKKKFCIIFNRGFHVLLFAVSENRYSQKTIFCVYAFLIFHEVDFNTNFQFQITKYCFENGIEA